MKGAQPVHRKIYHPFSILQIDQQGYSELWNQQYHLGWFSVGICKYKPSYKSDDLVIIRVVSLVEITAFRLESNFPPMRALEFITHWDFLCSDNSNFNLMR